MNRRINMGRMTAIAFALAGSALVAQVSTGTLTGAVKDGSGQPVAGVRVTLTSPAMQGTRTVVTGSNGEWRAPLLPVGYYKIAISKDGWVGGRAENVRVSLGSSSRQDLVMKPVAQQQATVEVVAAAADVDKGETKQTTNFSADQLAVLPGVSRGFTGAADLSAGLTTGVNGSFSVRGGATQNTQYRVNGTDVKDDYQGDITGTYMIEDNIEDVQVILSPLNARNGRALGGAVNVVTKSGSNSFSGSIRTSINRDSWRASTPRTRAGKNDTNDDLNKEYQITLSGPILKDHLWFSAGTIMKPSQSFSYSLGQFYQSYADSPVLPGTAALANVDQVLIAGPAGYAMTKFDEYGQYKQKYDDKYYEGKLTGALNANHTLEFSYSKSDVSLGPRNPFGDDGGSVGRLNSLGDQTEEKQAYGWNYRGVLSSNMFIEARLNKVDSRTVFPSGDASGNFGTGENMLVYQGATLALDYGLRGYRAGYCYPFGLGISPTPDRRNNRSGGVNFKAFVDAIGSHEIDAGVDYYQAVRGTSRQSGLKNQLFRIGGAYQAVSGAEDYLFPTINYSQSYLGNIQSADGLRGPVASLIEYLGKDGTTKNTTSSVYLNDQWTINSHWNVMVGLRYDKMKVEDTTGETLGDANDISPRLQVRFDPAGDSRQVYTLTAARYNGDFSTGFTDAFIQKADAKAVVRAWNANPYAAGDAADPTGLYGVRFYNYADITNRLNYGQVLSFSDNTKGYKIDKNLRAPILDELTLSYRRGWDNGSFAKLTFVHRKWAKEWAFARDYAQDYIVKLDDPSGSGLSPQYIIATRVFNSDKLTREYNGLELEWKGVINSVWTLGGNWTFSRLVGNNNGGDQGGGGQTFRDNTPSGYYTERAYLTGVMGLTDADIASTGPLVQDQTHRGRIWLTAVMPLGKGSVSYSFLLRYDSGTHFAVSGTAPINPTMPYLYGVPGDPLTRVSNRPTTYTQFYTQRGAYSQNDTYRADFKLNFQIPMGLPGFASKLMLIGDLQVQNLFNSQLVGSVRTTMRNDTAGSNWVGITDAPNFGTTKASLGSYWMGGRYVMASMGLKF